MNLVGRKRLELSCPKTLVPKTSAYTNSANAPQICNKCNIRNASATFFIKKPFMCFRVEQDVACLLMQVCSSCKLLFCNMFCNIVADCTMQHDLMPSRHITRCSILIGNIRRISYVFLTKCLLCMCFVDILNLACLPIPPPAH